VIHKDFSPAKTLHPFSQPMAHGVVDQNNIVFFRFELLIGQQPGF